MKKTNLLLSTIFIFIFYSAFIKAQTSNISESNYGDQITISAGLGVPVDYFAYNSLSDENSGFATNGASLGVSFEQMLSDSYCFNLRLNFSNNPYDIQPMNDFYKKSNRHAEVKDWKMYSFLIGVSNRIAINFFNYLELKASIGLAMVEFPEFKISMDNNEFATISAPSSSSFAVSCGIGYCLALSKNWFIKINTDYFLTRANFSGIVTKYSGGDSENNGNLSQSISKIDLSVGLGIKL